MHKRVLLLTLSLLPAFSCAYSGDLIPRQDAGPGGVQYRAGTVSYRNDAKADRRRADAVKKIEKYCGSQSYTTTKEGISPLSPDRQEIEFRCS
jgi:hypothetical protein